MSSNQQPRNPVFLNWRPIPGTEIPLWMWEHSAINTEGVPLVQFVASCKAAAKHVYASYLEMEAAAARYREKRRAKQTNG